MGILVGVCMMDMYPSMRLIASAATGAGGYDSVHECIAAVGVDKFIETVRWVSVYCASR